MSEKDKSGFTRWLTSSKEERQEKRRQANAKFKAKMDKLPIAWFDDVALSRESIQRGQTFPLAGVTAAVEAGTAPDRRTTATRVIGGAILAGPAGAIVGGVAKKKSGGEHYLVIAGPQFEWQIKFDAKKLDKARKFAALVNTTAKQLDE